MKFNKKIIIDKKIIIGSILLLIGFISLLISTLNSTALGDNVFLYLNPYVLTSFGILFFYVGIPPHNRNGIYILIGLIFDVFSLVLIYTAIPWIEAVTVLSLLIVIFWTFVFIIPGILTRNREYGFSMKQKRQYIVLPLTTFWLLLYTAVIIAFGQENFWVQFTQFIGVAVFLSILGSCIIVFLWALY